MTDHELRVIMSMCEQRNPTTIVVALSNYEKMFKRDAGRVIRYLQQHIGPATAAAIQRTSDAHIHAVKTIRNRIENPSARTGNTTWQLSIRPEEIDSLFREGKMMARCFNRLLNA